MSAIWGTHRLILAKDSAHIKEESWTFGQILSALLLLAPLITIAKIFTDHWIDPSGSENQGHPDNTIEVLPSSNSIPRSEDPLPTNPNHVSEVDGAPLETSQFQKHVQSGLFRDYYDHETCVWILPAVVLVCLQVLEVTVLFFYLVSPRLGAVVTVLGMYSGIILVLSPSLCFLFIYISLFVEQCFPDSKRWRSWAFISVLFSMFTLYSIWGMLSGFEARILKSGHQFGFLGILLAGCIFLLEAFSYIGPLVLAR